MIFRSVLQEIRDKKAKSIRESSVKRNENEKNALIWNAELMSSFVLH